HHRNISNPIPHPRWESVITILCKKNDTCRHNVAPEVYDAKDKETHCTHRPSIATQLPELNRQQILAHGNECPFKWRSTRSAHEQECPMCLQYCLPFAPPPGHTC